MRWTLHARRGLALFWPFLHFLDDGAKPAAHGISRLIGNFQHAGMAVLHGLDAGGHPLSIKNFGFREKVLHLLFFM